MALKNPRSDLAGPGLDVRALRTTVSQDRDNLVVHSRLDYLIRVLAHSFGPS